MGVQFPSPELSFGWKRMWGGIRDGEDMEKMGEVCMGTSKISSVALRSIR